MENVICPCNFEVATMLFDLAKKKGLEVERTPPSPHNKSVFIVTNKIYHWTLFGDGGDYRKISVEEMILLLAPEVKIEKEEEKEEKKEKKKEKLYLKESYVIDCNSKEESDAVESLCKWKGIKVWHATENYLVQFKYKCTYGFNFTSKEVNCWYYGAQRKCLIPFWEGICRFLEENK